MHGCACGNGNGRLYPSVIRFNAIGPAFNCLEAAVETWPASSLFFFAFRIYSFRSSAIPFCRTREEALSVVGATCNPFSPLLRVVSIHNGIFNGNEGSKYSSSPSPLINLPRLSKCWRIRIDLRLSSSLGQRDARPEPSLPHALFVCVPRLVTLSYIIEFAI